MTPTEVSHLRKHLLLVTGKLQLNYHIIMPANDFHCGSFHALIFVTTVLIINVLFVSFLSLHVLLLVCRCLLASLEQKTTALYGHYEGEVSLFARQAIVAVYFISLRGFFLYNSCDGTISGKEKLRRPTFLLPPLRC